MIPPKSISYTWVSTTDELAAALAVLPIDMYSLDTEFSSGYSYEPILGLVQLAFSNQILLIDPLSADLTPLRPLFESEALAIVHAGAQDLDLLERAVGTRPRRLFDTQIAASLLGYATPALASLVRQLGVVLNKSQQRADWLKRPLKLATLEYAAADVAYLPDIYQRLLTALTAKGRLSWLEEEISTLLARPLTKRVPAQEWWRIPSALSSNKSQQLLFQRLCAARDALAKTLNVPPSHVLSDASVVAVVKSMPVSLEALSVHPALATLAPEVRTTLLYPLYEPVQDGELRSPPSTLDVSEDRLVSVLSLYATALATDLNIDRTILATKSDLTEFIQGRPSRLDVMWRRQILTDDIEKLLRGTATLSLRDARLSVRSLGDS